MVPDSPLLRALVDPDLITAMAPSEQAQAVREARHTGLLGFLEARIDPNRATGKLRDHLLSARVQAEFNDTQISWEVQRLGAALTPMRGPVVLLKGAAYKALDLGLARGRLASDVDLLLPREQLQEAEQRLLEAGWEAMKEDEYDQRYYREWMHELPPLRHKDWGTVVDLHHTILPLTSRLKPSAEKLLASAIPMPEPPFFNLRPEDTVLHRVAHLFYGGDLRDSLRELVDIHELICAYGDEPNFVDTLISRAQEQDLARPLYYAVHCCSILLHTPFPQGTAPRLEKHAGSAWSRTWLRRLMIRQLITTTPQRRSLPATLAGWMLFIRSHWITMPPLMLARHLLTQAWRRGGIKTAQ